MKWKSRPLQAGAFDHLWTKKDNSNLRLSDTRSQGASMMHEAEGVHTCVHDADGIRTEKRRTRLRAMHLERVFALVSRFATVALAIAGRGVDNIYTLIFLKKFGLGY